VGRDLEEEEDVELAEQPIDRVDVRGVCRLPAAQHPMRDVGDPVS